MSDDQTRLILDPLAELEKLSKSNTATWSYCCDLEEFPAQAWSAVNNWIKDVEDFLAQLPEGNSYLAIFRDGDTPQDMNGFFETLQVRGRQLDKVISQFQLSEGAR